MSLGHDIAVRGYAARRRALTRGYLARNPALVAGMMTADAFGALLPKRAKPIRAAGRRVLVSNLGHIGDVLTLTPLLAALRADRRVAEVGLLIGPWCRPLTDLADLADRVHVFAHWALDRSEAGRFTKLGRHAGALGPLIGELRAAEYDAAIDTYGWFGNAAGVLWAAGIPARAGLTSGGASTLYTHRVAFDPAEPIGANYARVAETLFDGLTPSRPALPGFTPDPKAAAIARELRRFVILHVGRSDPHKIWPRNAWEALGKRLKAAGYEVALTGVADEREATAPLAQAIGGRDLAGAVNLRGFATLIAAADGLVCVDTSAGHFAACFQTPSAVLTPGIHAPALWSPQQPYARRLSAAVACAPCNRTVGCAALACLQLVTPDAVYDALMDAIRAKAASGVVSK